MCAVSGRYVKPVSPVCGVGLRYEIGQVRDLLALFPFRSLNSIAARTIEVRRKRLGESLPSSSGRSGVRWETRYFPTALHASHSNSYI